MIVFKCSSSKQKEENLLIVNFTNGGGIQTKKGDPQSIFKPKKKKETEQTRNVTIYYNVHTCPYANTVDSYPFNTSLIIGWSVASKISSCVEKDVKTLSN